MLAGHLEREWYPPDKKRTKRGPATFSDKSLVEFVDRYKQAGMTDAAALRKGMETISKQFGLQNYRWRKHERTWRNRLSIARKIITK